MKTIFAATLATLVLTGGAAVAEEPGKAVFDKQCSYCHAAGDDRPGTFQLGRTRGEEFALLEARTDLTADYIRYVVRHGLNAMPPFKPTGLTEEDLKALTDYLAKADQ